MTYCYFDTETRTPVPISHGTDVYTASATCIIATWAINDGPVRIWDRFITNEFPQELEEAVRDPSVIFIAHQAPFDRRVLARLGRRVHPRRWRCTRVQAYAHGLPGSLEILGAVLGLSTDEAKLVDDAKLIHLFCEPRADGTWATPVTHPAEWARFCNYAVRDTVALREVHKRLPAHNFQGRNLKVWELDQLINERGFQFDARLATEAVRLLAVAKEKNDGNMRRGTDGDVTAGTQRARLLKYLTEKCGLDIPNLRASTIRDMLEGDDLSPEVRFLLETRLEAAMSSGSKYRRGLVLKGEGDRLRHALQMNGAGRTGRWSGKGFQPHNMRRVKVKKDVVSEMAKTVLSGAADLVYS